MIRRISIDRRFLQTTAAFVIAAGIPVSAYADPQGGSVSSGSASISSSNGHTIIDQSSDRAIIRWDSFDIDSAEHVQFRQPTSSSITVNRIMDSKASRIDGRLSANGNIVLINPNGMVFGSSAVVDVGGLVATTSDLDDDNEFMNGGAVKFTRPGNADAKIVNNGNVTVKDAGLAGLVAPQVENNGVIQARMGRVQLASGDIHTIDFAGDGLIKLEVSTAVGKQAVINRGTINADGGDVLITAAQAKHVVDVLVENSGTVRANTVGQRAGTIKISTKGIDDTTEKAKGRIVNTGAVYAMGDDTGEEGGSIRILADDITVGDGSVLDASGDTDGGEILLGGDYQGGGNVPTSDYLRIDRNVTLNAGSRRTGKGGKIIGWADMDTLFYGHAVASAAEGDGGLIEMSGKRYLDFGGTVDLRGVNGASGILLLDPTDITISSGADSNVTGASPYTPTADSVTSVLNVSTLLAALASGNVIVQTRATGAQSGNITVADALSWASGNALTLDAHGQIIINAAISGGSLEMTAGADVALNAAVGGTGTLTIQQRADATTIGIGASAVGVLNLSAADLLNIQNGWSDIVLGRETATSAMDIRGTTWTDNLTLRSGTGVINVMGVVDTGANNMTVIAGGDIAIAAAGRQLTGTGTLTIRPSTTTTTVGLGAAGNINLSTTEIARLHGTWSDVIIGRTDSSVVMAVAAVTWNDALTLMNGTGAINVSGVQTMGANALTFITDGDIALGVSNALYGSTTLTFKQASANVGIGLGDAQAGGLNLNNTDVARIRNGWNSIVMGRSDSTADINVGALTWNDSLTLRTGTGSVNIAGLQTMAANHLVIDTVGGAVAFTGGVSQTTGNLLVNTLGGSINIAAALAGTTTGTWTFDSNNGLITIGNTITKTGGTLNIDSGTSTLTIGAAISGAATAINIDVSGGADIQINNTLTTTTGAVSLTTAGGKITSSVGGTISQTTGNVSMTTNGGQVRLDGTVTQGGAAASGNLTITSGGGAVALNNTITRLAGIMTVNAGAGGITVANTIGLSASALDFDVTGAAIIDLNGGLNMGAGALSMNSDSGVIDIAGPISITTGATNIVSGSGDIILGNSFTATTGSVNLATGGGDIFTRAITQTTGATTLASANGTILIDGAINKTGGTLDVGSGIGQLTFAGAVALGAGTAILTTDSNISLGGAFSGTGSFTLVQANNNVSIGVGTGQAGTVHLDDTEFGYIQDGWSSRTFGRSDSMAAMNIKGGLTWTDSLILQTGTGSMNLNGAIAVGTGNGLTLRTDSNVSILGDLSGTGAFALVQSTNAVGMGIGDGQAGTVHVSTAEHARILNGWSGITLGRTDSTAAINVFSATWNDSLVIRSGSGHMTIAGAVMAGNNITMITDSDIAINGNITGTGTLAVYGASAATSMGIGDGQAGTISLSNTELSKFGSTWGSQVFGVSSMSGDINIGTRTWSDPLSLRTGTGMININGVVTMGGNNIALTTDGDINIDPAGKLTGTGALLIASTLAVTSFGLGDGQSGTVTLSTDEIGRINGTFSGITIGGTGNTGSINLGALTWNDPVVIRNGAGAFNVNGEQKSGGNNLTLYTNSNISINDLLTGTGSLTIYGANGTSIGVGTGQAGTLSLSDDELDRIATGWTNVIIGSTSMTGAMNIAGRTWNNSMDFRTNSGALNINGAQNMGSNNLILRTNTNLSIGQILAGTGTLSILNSGTANTNTMGVGDGQAGQLQLSNTEIDMFKGYGWTTIALGNASSQGALNVGAGTWSSNLVLRNSGSASNFLKINGAIDVGSNNLTLQSNNDIYIDFGITGTGTLTIGQVSATVGLGVGDGQAGAVAISNAELARATGWGSMVFGTTATTTSTYAAINVGAYTWNNNLTLRSSGNAININGAQNLGANNLTFDTGANPTIGAALNGTGTLSFNPYAVATTVGIAGGAGTLGLTTGELAQIGAGWSKISIGRSDGTGAMVVSSTTWNNNLFLTTGTGLLTVAGANMGSKNLEIATNSNLAITGNLSGTGALTIRNSSGLNSIGVGAAGSNITLDSTEIGRIQDGWSYVQIGSENSFGDINIAANNWLNPMRFVTKSDIVVNGAQTTTETAGTSMVFATTAGKFINNAGGSAINPGGGRYLVYSIDEANDTIGGLVRPTILTNLSYAGYGPTAVTETGDVYIYAGTAAKILTLMINDVDKVYGDLNPTYSYSYVAGLQNGDILGNIILTASMSAAGSNVLDNAGTTRLINGSFTLDGGYTLNLITGTLTVIKASVTVTADSDSREYGVANGPLTISYDGFRNGDDETTLSSQATASTAATILSDVGSYAITASGAADSNYDFIYVDGTLDITKATLTATVQNATREYGAADPAFNIVYSGFRNGDTQAVIDTLGTGTTAATATSNVGSYAINGGGAVDNNYAFNYIDGSLSITKAMLTATTQSDTREYGVANPTLGVVYTGFRNGETAAVIDTLATASTAAGIGSNVGSYGISATGAADNNYDFTYANTGNLSVTKAMLTVTADNNTRVYGDANPAFTVSYSGFRNGDTATSLTTQATAGTAATVLSDVGSYAITATGAASGNYDFTYNQGSLSVTKAMLTVTTQDNTREYGLANPVLSASYSGFRNGDTFGVIDTAATVSSLAGLTSNVGSYGITATGASDNNYDFSYVNTGTLSVTKAMLTATTQNATREYGIANPTLGVVYTGFRNGETTAVIDTLATASTAAMIGSNVGSYGISASGAVDNNYDFTYANTGNLSVTKAMLTVTADNNSRVYGAANPALGVSYSGFRNGDAATSLITQATAATGATVLSDAGTYAITASGAAAGNYDFTYAAGVLTVGKADIIATVSSGTREYGAANPAFTVAYTGFVNGDDETDIDVSAGISAPGATTNVGTHAVSASGGSDNNYNFVYVDGALTVTKAMLTATAADATRAAGAANPTFTVNYTGFRNGETASVIDTPATASSVADASSPVGTYAILASGALDNNYNFTYVSGILDVTGAVAPAPTPVASNGSTGGSTSIPVTVEDVLTGRNIRHAIVTQPYNYNVQDIVQSGIAVISEDSIFNRNTADNSFLIAITEKVKNFDFGYNQDEDPRQ
jgi:filamentous hemagglutinin family protein